MQRTPFRLWHSAGALALVLFVQCLITSIIPSLALWAALCASVIATPFLVYVSTEVIAEVHLARRMLMLLSVVVAEFVVFFAFQYAFFAVASPESFPTLPHDPVALLLQSVMVFVFNPLYIPDTSLGRALMLINTFGAVVLVLFIFQNMHSFRHRQDSAAV